MPSPRTALNGYRPDIGTMFDFDVIVNQAGFIGPLVAPVIESAVQAGTYGRIPLKQFLKEPEVGRNSRGEYNRTNLEFEDATFSTSERGIEIPVDRRQAKMYEEFFDFEVVCARIALDIVLRRAERRYADMIFNATTFTSQTTTAGTVWTDYTNAVPVTNVNTAIQEVWDRTGIWPDSLIVSRRTFRDLRMCDEVTDKLHSDGAGVSIEPGKITAAQLASVFDLRQVVIAGAARDSANEGQSATVASMWADNLAMVAKLASTNNIEEPCLARTVHWGEDGSQVGGAFETYYDDRTRGDIARVRHDVEERIMYVELGELIDNVRA